MSKKKKAISPQPGPVPAQQGWDGYAIIGTGNEVGWDVVYNVVTPGYIQIWYQSDTVPRQVLTTLSGSTSSGTIETPDARVGPNPFAWATLVNLAGQVIEEGAHVDIAD